MMDNIRYEIDYGSKILETEKLFNYLVSRPSTFISVVNPGEEPVAIKPGCKLMFVQIGS